MRRVNHQMRYPNGFIILVRMDVKILQVATCCFDGEPVTEEPLTISKGPVAREGEEYLIGAVSHHHQIRSGHFFFNAQQFDFPRRAGP